jgi:hypothetical protein
MQQAVKNATYNNEKNSSVGRFRGREHNKFKEIKTGYLS